MVDTDLSSRDSKIEFFGKDCDAKNTAPVIYYTPQTGIIISLSSNTELALPVTLYDVAGRLIRKESSSLKTRYNTFTMIPV